MTFLRLAISGCILMGYLSAASQQANSIHAHNDYAHKTPFWESYRGGAASIEADVFLKGGQLYVTHDEAEIKPGRTLQSLYLKPLLELAQAGRLRELQLLIDLKSEASSTLNRLVELLQGYPALTGAARLRFVISGNRPAPEHYGDFPGFIRYDWQDPASIGDAPLKQVALVSVSFRNYSSWNGHGKMPAADLKAVRNVIEQAHAASLPVRFWATPDTREAWRLLARLGVDYLNTDTPARARRFLDRLSTH